MRESLELNGFAYVRGYRRGTPTHDIANSLGEISTVGSRGPVELRPTRQADSEPTSYSGLYGRRRFPFHTDLAHWRRPPRYILLRCKVGSEVATTDLIDGFRIISEIHEPRLQLAQVQPRRPIKGRLPLLRLYSQGPSHLVRWDEVFIVPANESGRVCCEAFRNKISLASRTSFSLVDEADTLLIDNWRMLHSRSGIPPRAHNRIIERVYLETLNETDNQAGGYPGSVAS